MEVEEGEVGVVAVEGVVVEGVVEEVCLEKEGNGGEDVRE